MPYASPHRLRHTLASEMLAAGVSLGDIGQVLGHRGCVVTAAYAKVDLQALRMVARRWPEVATGAGSRSLWRTTCAFAARWATSSSGLDSCWPASSPTLRRPVLTMFASIWPSPGCFWPRTRTHAGAPSGWAWSADSLATCTPSTRRTRCPRGVSSPQAEADRRRFCTHRTRSWHSWLPPEGSARRCGR
ncbi:MAG: tyrosine-type recombinase/integrase [Pseudonocardiaceae bacterium]